MSLFISNVEIQPVVYNKKSTVTMMAIYNSGGIGDFLRSALSFYVFCHRNNIEFYFDFEGVPGMKSCFEYPECDYQGLPCINYFFIGGQAAKGNPEIEYLYDLILNSPGHYRISCNLFMFEDYQDIKNVIGDFLKLLKPSSQVISRMNQLLPTWKDRLHMSAHIRCGDFYMTDAQCSEDKRVIVDNDYIRMIQRMIPSNGLIHTDNLELKKALATLGYKTFDIAIQHTCVIGDTQGYIDTIAEFFILANAHTIIQFKYSGFSHWAHIIGNNNLVALEKHPNLEWSESI